MLVRIKENLNGHSVAVATALILLFAVVGCGGKKSTSGESEPLAQQPQVPTTVQAPEYQPVVQDEPALVPEQPRVVTYEEAEAAFNDRKYVEATRLFAAYTEQKPENPWGYYMLGLSARNSGDAASAITALEKAAQLDSLHAKTWINLSRARLDASQPEEALLDMDRAIELGGESAATLRTQGRAYHQLGQSEDAIAAYRQAIIFNPDDAWSMNNMALVLIEDGLFEDALPVLARAIELKENVSLFHNNFGMALENSNHIVSSINAYTRATEVDSSYEKARINLARVEAVVPDSNDTEIDADLLADRFEETVSEWITAADMAMDGPDSLSVSNDIEADVLEDSSDDGSSPDSNVQVVDQSELIDSEIVEVDSRGSIEF